jgi:hypothetical protein
MTDWTHPTLADTGVTEEVRCKCRRIVRPDRMYEVRALGVGDAYRCSACVEGFFRSGVERLTFYRRGGASEEWLAAHDAKLKRGPLTRPGLSQEQWGEIYARALEDRLLLDIAAGLAPAESTWEAQVTMEQARQAAAQAQLDSPPDLL